VLAIPVFVLGLIIAVIFATLFGSYRFGIDQISDLGSIEFTPFPYIMNLTFIIAPAFLFCFFTCLFHGVYKVTKKRRLKIAPTGTIISYVFFLITTVAFFFSGIFSLDVSYVLHRIFTILSFVPLLFGEFIIGYQIIRHRVYHIIFGLSILFGHLSMALLYMVFPSGFMEWMMFFVLLLWGVPLSFIIYKDLRSSESSKSNFET
jgi:hypothetical protein